MKDNDEGGDEGCGEGGDEGSDEGGEWLILRCLRGFEDRRTDGRTDICECRVASATEKTLEYGFGHKGQKSIIQKWPKPFQIYIYYKNTYSKIFWTILFLTEALVSEIWTLFWK